MRATFVYLGRTTWRQSNRPFGFGVEDRRLHTYIVGKTGVGKSSLIESLVRQDIEARRGIALLDPHGEVVERVSRWMPDAERDRVAYVDVPSGNSEITFNPLERVVPERRSLAAAGFVEGLRKIFADSWGVRLEYLLRNALLLLLDQPTATLSDVLRLFRDVNFRKAALGNSSNEHVRRFWLVEYPSYHTRFQTEAVTPIENKLGAFLIDPYVSRFLNAERSSFNLRELMDSGGILLVNIAKGKIGEGPAALVGALLTSSIALAGLSRADISESARRDFILYGDEFQTYTTVAIADMAAELRKYHVSLVLANQYLAQLDREVRDALLGNVGTLIVFRVGASDAATLARELGSDIEAEDLVYLPNRNFFVRMTVKGEAVRPFSGETIELRAAA